MINSLRKQNLPAVAGSIRNWYYTFHYHEKNGYPLKLVSCETVVFSSKGKNVPFIFSDEKLRELNLGDEIPANSPIRFSRRLLKYINRRGSWMMKRMMTCLLMLCLLCSFSFAGGESVPIPDIQLRAMKIPQNEAMNHLRRMGTGLNLGNTFDAVGGPWIKNHMEIEKAWTGFYTTRDLIESVAKAGFGFIRIPVSWHDHVDSEFRIAPEWLDRVQEVADWALEAGLYVIINTHHDNEPAYYYPDSAHLESSRAYLSAIWRQMAERFRDYDDRLMLESLNEPRLKDTPYEWNFNAKSAECRDSAEVINALNQLFVDTVRATGGNNATRYLCVPGYDGAPPQTANGIFTLPQDSADNRIIVSAHAYVPYDFALKLDGGREFSWDNAAQREDILGNIDVLYNTYLSRGIPAIMDECGCLDHDGNLRARVEWCAGYAAAAQSRGLPIAWWDNGALHTKGENFAIFNRSTGELLFPEIVDALMKYRLPAPAEDE